MKKLAMLTLILAGNLSANTNSLWCSLSNYGTPSETAQRNALPFAEIQIDKMSDASLQLYIVDHYENKTSVTKVFTTKNMSGQTINGLFVGAYTSLDKGDAILRVKDGRINLIFQQTRFDCEIPGDYQADYSLYVK